MFCPSCRAEYRESVSRCPDCDVDLVAELTPASEMDEEDLVSVLDTADVAVLPVIKSVLSSADIPFVVQGDEAVGVLPVGRVGVGGISVSGHGLSAAILVPRDREEEARELLTQLPELDDST